LPWNSWGTSLTVCTAKGHENQHVYRTWRYSRYFPSDKIAYDFLKGQGKEADWIELRTDYDDARFG